MRLYTKIIRVPRFLFMRCKCFDFNDIESADILVKILKIAILLLYQKSEIQTLLEGRIVSLSKRQFTKSGKNITITPYRNRDQKHDATEINISSKTIPGIINMKYGFA